LENPIELIIPGKPIAKKRPRFVRRGKFVGTYSDQETEEGRFILEVKSQLNGCDIIKGPVKLTVTCFMPIPKSTSKKKKAQMLRGEIKHTKKPDFDNLIKFICDCLNGIVWKDDSQVYMSSILKIYAEHPMTIISILDAG
jgi:Holliday junction resolvase RusA-like endonuclease